MGGHASPILCAIAVAFDEYMWTKAYNIQLHHSFLCIRYVDNRLTFMDSNLQTINSYNRFLDFLFYQYPVELEDCGNNIFLGYTIDMEQLSMAYVIPEESHAYRSIRSAGTTAKVLSGLTARLRLLYRGTFPSCNRLPLAKILIQKYEDKGFPKSILTSMLFKVTCKYPKH